MAKAHRNSRPTFKGSAICPITRSRVAAVIGSRSIRAFSRMNSTTETKNSASRGIRVLR